MALLFRRLHEALDRNTAAFDRNAAAFDRNAAASDRNAAAFEDLQVVIRESRIREERAFRAFEARLEEHGETIRAQTEALWKLLERWGQGPTSAS